MNDVLPKPFTKEGMLRALEKHLPNFKKDAQFPPNGGPQVAHSGFVTPSPGQAPLGLTMAPLSATQSLKEEASPGKSPITVQSWQSPNQLPGPSPIGSTPGGYMQPMGDNRQYNMTPTHSHPQNSFPPPPNTAMGHPQGPPRPGVHRRAMPDMTGPGSEEHAEKRQRLYPAGPGGFPQ